MQKMGIFRAAGRMAAAGAVSQGQADATDRRTANCDIHANFPLRFILKMQR